MASLASPVIWDGYGVQSPFSGIGRHVCRLYEGFTGLGLRPLLLTSKSAPFASWNQIRTLERSEGRLGKIVASKAFHSLHTLPQILHRLKTQLPRQSIIFHALSNFNLPAKQIPNSGFSWVLTVHDLIPLLASHQVSRSLNLQMRYLMEKAVNRADRIICVSDWTMRTLIEQYPSVESRTIHISNGIIRPSSLSVRMTCVSRETDRHLLMVSRFEHYKRFDRLVAVMRRIDHDIRATVITDLNGEKWFHSNAQDLLRAGRLTLLRAVSDQTLASLYKNSSFLFHPSEYEGFCLPAAEAISCGLPVLYQSGSGIDEVVQGCGLGLSKGFGIDDWVGAVNKLLQDRPNLDIEAWVNTQKSWPDVARDILRVYNDVESP